MDGKRDIVLLITLFSLNRFSVASSKSKRNHNPTFTNHQSDIGMRGASEIHKSRTEAAVL